MKKTKLSEAGFFIVLTVTALAVIISTISGLPAAQVKTIAVYVLGVATAVYLIALFLVFDIDTLMDDLDNFGPN